MTRSLSWITRREFWSWKQSKHTVRLWETPLQIWTLRQCVCFTESRTCHLTCSIMCLTFLCWHFSMSSRWWIFSLRTATSFSSCSALKIHTELWHWSRVYCHFLCCMFRCACANLWSPFWPSSLNFCSSRSSSSRLRIASRRVALSCSMPPSSLCSSSMRWSFFSLASSVIFSFCSWLLRCSLSLLPSALKRHFGEKWLTLLNCSQH